MAMRKRMTTMRRRKMASTKIDSAVMMVDVTNLTGSGS
jgi:hypothetical protein